MAMNKEWDNRNEGFGHKDATGRRYPKNHNALMKEFRGFHDDVALVNAPRLDQAALLESMSPLQVRYHLLVTGESRFHGNLELSSFMPLMKIARYKLS